MYPSRNSTITRTYLPRSRTATSSSTVPSSSPSSSSSASLHNYGRKDEGYYAAIKLESEERDRERSSSLSPVPSSDAEPVKEEEVEEEKKGGKKRRLRDATSSPTPKKKKTMSGDLRSFFAPPSTISSNTKSAKSLSKSYSASSLASSALRPSKSASAIPKAADPKPILHQLQLMTDKPVHITCPLCQMSYVRTSSLDREAHNKFCARFRCGIEWKEGTGGKVVWESKEGKIVCVEGLGKGKEKTKLQAMLELVEHALNSSPLSSETMKESKSYIYVDFASQKAVGICLAHRITQCYRVLPPIPLHLLKPPPL
ncbi:hypothetical protein BT69DRAFT_1315960 [Atractiella rhizophila]|nr:hypothetical protein BT69DRAFT_1315960 [Atractiella rhizophila]